MNDLAKDNVWYSNVYEALFDGKELKNLPCNHPAKQLKGSCHAFSVELEMEMAGLFLYMG